MRLSSILILVLAAQPGRGDGWFLSPAELDDSRGGDSRSATGILDVSTGNEVQSLINGKAVMLALLADISAAGAGDSIFVTFFELNGDVMLDPTASNPESTKLTTVLVAAAHRNATLKILVNDNIYLHSGLSFCHTINTQACPGKTCCAPETRHHSAGGSVHSKAWCRSHPVLPRSDIV